MKFKQITSKTKLFDKLWKLYHSAFPPDAKKSKKWILATLNRKEYSFMAIYDKELIGLLSFWRFKDFSFIEYLAIFPKFRKKGYATKVLKQFLKKGFILETEPPLDKFYNKFGIKTNNFKYVQPALSKNKKPFPALIMSYPKKLNTKEYQKVKETLYKEVYKENI